MSVAERARRRAGRKGDGLRRAVVVTHRLASTHAIQMESLTQSPGLWRHLVEHGYAVTRICAAFDERSAAELRALSSKDVDIVPLVPTSRRIAVARYRELAGIFTSLEPDVVHVVGEPWQAGTVATLRAAKAAGALAGVHFAENGPALRGVPGLVRRAGGLAGLRRADYAIGWTSAAGRLARRAWGFRGHVDAFPSDAVPDYFFDQGDSAADREGILFVGRLVPEKGIHELLELSRRLSPEGVTITVIGFGPGAAAMERASLDGSIEFLGRQSRREVAAALARARVTIVPSKPGSTKTPAGSAVPSTEQFGRIVVESLAAGTPVVAHDLGELRDALGPGGALVPVGAFDEFEKHVRNLVFDDDAWTSFAAAGREWAAQFSERALAARLAGVWGSIDS